MASIESSGRDAAPGALSGATAGWGLGAAGMITVRSSSALDAAAAIMDIGAPHFLQNFASGLFSAPHELQCFTCACYQESAQICARFFSCPDVSC